MLHIILFIKILSVNLMLTKQNHQNPLSLKILENY